MSGDVDRLQSLGMALANISIRMKISVKKIEESLETIIKVMNLERDRDEARAEVERLRRGIEAYRRLVSVHRVEAHGVNTHQTITNNNHASAVWQWEAEQ